MDIQTIRQKAREISLDERQYQQILRLMAYSFSGGMGCAVAQSNSKWTPDRPLSEYFNFWVEQMPYIQAGDKL